MLPVFLPQVLVERFEPVLRTPSLTIPPIGAGLIQGFQPVRVPVHLQFQFVDDVLVNLIAGLKLLPDLFQLL